MTVPAENQRLDYLDAVRAFALLLGIVFHASLSFLPVYIGWAVMDVSTSPLVSLFSLISHSFRMELFFLIAGFFSHMTFHRKGSGPFLRSRFLRIALPFVVGWFILRPLIVSGWVMGAESMQGDVNILSGLASGFLSLAELPKGLLIGSHLWFLYYVLLITTATLSLRALISYSPPLAKRLRLVADTTVAWLSHSKFALLALAVPTALCIGYMSHWGMDTPDKSLLIHVPVFIVYGGIFNFGWLLHRQTHLIETFARLSLGRFVLCFLSIIAATTLSDYQGDPGHPQFAYFHAAFAISYALMMWTLVALSIGLFKRFFDRPSKRVRYLADSSYWLYLIHLPLVIWLQVAFAELPWHWSLKLATISILTVAIALVIYDLLIRPTVIGSILNGRPKPRALFRRT